MMPTETPDWLLWLVAIGVASGALGTIWRIWLGPGLMATREAIKAAVEISRLLREVRDFMRDSLPQILQRLDAGADRFEEHSQRIEQLENHVWPERQRQPSNAGEE